MNRYQSIAMTLLAICLMSVAIADELSDKVESIYPLQANARKEAQVNPYRAAQHAALKNYFGEIASIAVQIKEAQKPAQRWNKLVSKANLGELCQRLIVPKVEWDAIMSRCTKNQFFLCAEEVKAYPLSLEVLRARLGAEEQARWDGTVECRLFK